MTKLGNSALLASLTATVMFAALSAAPAQASPVGRTTQHAQTVRHPTLAPPFTLASGTVNNGGLDTDTSFCYEPDPLPTSITDDPANPKCTPPPADPTAVNPYDISPAAGGWAAPLTGSTWVGPQANGQDTMEQVPGWYVYDTEFQGCATLSGNAFADNEVGVFLNGSLLADSASTAPYSFHSPPLNFTGLTTNTGLNVIDLVVYDSSGSETGLDYSITVTPTDCSTFPVPAIGLVKSASVQSYSAAGTVITYTYTVTNTGDVPLSNVAVTDPMPGLSSITCSGSGTLSPGASETCTATYTTTGQDVTQGAITNVGTATGDPPSGPAVSYNSSLTIPETGHALTCTTPTSFISQLTSAACRPSSATRITCSAPRRIPRSAPPTATPTTRSAMTRRTASCTPWPRSAPRTS